MEPTDELVRSRLTELASVLPQSTADPSELAVRGRAAVRRRRSIATGVGLALAAAISAPVAVLTLDGGQTTSQTQADDAQGPAEQFAPVNDGMLAEQVSSTEPCGGLIHVDLSRLDSGPVPVVQPNLDGQELEIVGAGICEGSASRPVIFLGREPGEIDAWILYETGQLDQSQNYRDWFEAIARTWGGRVLEISDASAYVSVADTPAAMNQVLVPISANVLARIQSAPAVGTASAADLIDVAESLVSTH